MKWFTLIKAGFGPRVMEFAGQPITYVEIGCWEGASAKWVADNVLTHPDSHGFGIDPYAPCSWREKRKAFVHSQEEMDEHERVAHETLSNNDNFQFIREHSELALRRFDKPIDLLYIDGAHTGPAALIDFCIAWHSLREGAGVIFDDYGKGLKKPFAHVPACVSAIEECFGNLLTPWEHEASPAIWKQAYFRVRSKQPDQAWFQDQRHRVSS